MAFSPKYRSEFYDTHGLEWRWDFELDPFVGDPTLMQASGDPGTYEPLSDVDDVLKNPVRGTKATLRVKSMSMFQYLEFFTMTDMKMRCSIYYGSAHTLYFRGYVNVNNYSEPYDDYPYDVAISVNCGLGLLKEIPYEASAGVPYTGRLRESQIVLDILGKIGFTTFTEIVNIYEYRMASGVNDSPIDQLYIDASVFDDMTCYEALEYLLSKWHALIRQRLGVFVIYRPTEMITTAYARTFTAATTKTGSTITALMPLRRSTSATADLRDHNGGRMMPLSAVKKITMDQDYGNKVSWLSNYLFDSDTYDESVHLFESWSAVGIPSSFIPLGRILGKELQGVYMLYTIAGTIPDVSCYLYQDMGSLAVQTSDVFGFSFDYRLINPTGAAVASVDVCIEIADVARTQWVNLENDDTTCLWYNSLHYINFTVASVPKGANDWVHFETSIPGLPVNGPFRIKLFQTNKSIFIAYKDIRFFATSNEILYHKKQKFWIEIIKHKLFRVEIHKYAPAYTELVEREEIVGKSWDITNAIEGIEEGREFILGDANETNINNVIEQFRGSLGIITAGGSLSQTAADFVNDFAADYIAGYVLVTSLGTIIIFTSSMPGINFTGNTTIVNATGDLAGTVTTVTANDAGTKQKETLDLTAGTGGDFNIIFASTNHITTFDTSLAITAAAFVTNHAASFATYGISVTSDGTNIIFEEALAQGGFSQPVFYADPLGDMEGEWYTGAPEQVAAVAPVARVDHVTLSGTSGTATVTCDGVARTVTFNTSTVLDYTTNWNTRGGAENDPLLEIVGGELGDQTSAPRQLLSVPMFDLTDNDINPHVDVIGCFQDDLNLSGAQAVIFAFNRGVFDMKNRHWDIDMVEVGLGGVPANVLLNDDGTPITNDDGTNIETN
jgi:hypothetical protein